MQSHAIPQSLPLPPSPPPPKKNATAEAKPEKSGFFGKGKKDKGRPAGLRKKRDDEDSFALFRVDPLIK